MWLMSDSSQTAETASLNPWSMEQNKWGGNSEYGNGLAFEDPMRAILPPAFRNSASKVVWNDSSATSSLEANVNEALGISGWATAGNQMTDQDFLTGPTQQQSYLNGLSGGWGQTEIDQQRPWDVGNTSILPSRTTSGPPQFCNPNVAQNNKVWPTNDEQSLNLTLPRQSSLTCAPPPNYMNGQIGGWVQQDQRSSSYLPPQGPRNATPYDVNGLSLWGQRGVVSGPMPVSMPPAGIPPPPRSRLNVWSGNGQAPDMGVPPPSFEYNAAMGHWMPPSSVGKSVPGSQRQMMQINQYDSCSPPLNNAKFTQNAPRRSNSFMGDDAVWQDPNGDARKWLRDTGTAIWGDPDKQPAEIHNWLIPPGSEYDTVYTEKKAPSGEELDGSSELKNAAQPVLAPHVIVSTGWGDLPPITKANCAGSLQNSSAARPTSGGMTWTTSNSQQINPTTVSGGWGSSQLSHTPVKQQSPWDIPEKQNMPLSPWGKQHMRYGAQINGTTAEIEMPPATQAIADQLRVAVAKGLLDVQLLSRPLSHQTLALISTLLDRLPILEQFELDLSVLLDAVKLNSGGELLVSASPRAAMIGEQQNEYDRLVIEIAATKTDIAAIREKIRESCEPPKLRSTMSSSESLSLIQKSRNEINPTTSSMVPRFGDSILDVTANAGKQRPYFTIF